VSNRTLSLVAILFGFFCITERGNLHVAGRATSPFLFDDFSYRDHEEFAKHGWIVRTAPGWPGLPGATWRKEGVTFHDDPDHPDNRIIRMTSFTDGIGADTQQSQICHERKYKDGTYAARVRFSDRPVSGPDGDQIVESFYAISPLKAPMDPDYSELDFEYLPHGGWGKKGPTLWVTSWFTFSPEPNWKQENTSNSVSGSKEGWHTLVTQVANGEVKYFIDGKPLGEHKGRYYPRSLMSINFNLWFIKNRAVKSHDVRRYTEEIDWVFFEQNEALSPEQVESKVVALRQAGTKFVDNVPAPVPRLSSPCDF
jgi:hypothetical protein